MKTRILAAVLLAFGLGGFAGCANTDTQHPTPGNSDDGDTTRKASLVVTSDALADTDISHMKFQLTAKNCDPGVTPPDTSDLTKVKGFSSMFLPGGFAEIPEVTSKLPYENTSQHIFSDAFFSVVKDCDYDVLTQPLRSIEPELNSQDCAPARRTVQQEQINGKDNSYFELYTLVQCEGEPARGIDVGATVNHPPDIKDLSFSNSKFVASCQDKREVCVQASDPDSDRLEFEWTAERDPIGVGAEQVLDPQNIGSIKPIVTTQKVPGTDRWESCARLATNRQGSYAFRVKAFDLGKGGQRLEEVAQSQQLPGDNVTSRDTQNFPIYSGLDCRGRHSTILMAMSKNNNLNGKATQFIKDVAKWVGPLAKLQNHDILYVKDDCRSGGCSGDEHPGDLALIENALKAQWPGQVDVKTEPTDGLPSGYTDGYDIVWFTNPGFPIDDDAKTYRELRRFMRGGGGLVMQGDDMAGPANGILNYKLFHRQDYVNNGRFACEGTPGQTRIDGGADPAWSMDFASLGELEGEPSQANMMLDPSIAGDSFSYNSDIDKINVVNPQQVIPLAAGSFFTSGCGSPDTRVGAVAVDPVDLPGQEADPFDPLLP